MAASWGSGQKNLGFGQGEQAVSELMSAEEILTDFFEGWKAADDEKEQHQLLQTVIYDLAFYPALEQDLAVPQLSAISGIGKTIIRRALMEAKRDMRKGRMV